MNTQEILLVIDLLKSWYNKSVVMIESIEDNYDGIKIVTLYGETLFYNRKDKALYIEC